MIKWVVGLLAGFAAWAGFRKAPAAAVAGGTTQAVGNHWLGGCLKGCLIDVFLELLVIGLFILGIEHIVLPWFLHLFGH